MRAYQTRAGLTQYMQSIGDIQNADENNEGFCLACGEIQSGVEPDARRYRCESCEAHKVYGAAELALMGLVY